MNSFDATKIKAMREIIQKALDEIKMTTGVELKLGKINYDIFSFDASLSAVIEDKKFDEEKAEFEKLCFHYGFKKDDYGKTFEWANNLSTTTYTLYGFAPRSKKYHVLARNPNGKTYKWEIDVVKRMLAKNISKVA